MPWICKHLSPKSVIDVGCGTGTWLSVFRSQGIKEALGVDGPWVPKAQLEIPLECFQPLDLTRPDTLRLNRTFDLVVSLEVAEHLPEDLSIAFVEALTQLGDVQLFAAAAPAQGGVGHENEQPPKYWIERFNKKGFACLDIIRSAFWEDAEVAPWYAQNSFLFINQTAIARYPDIQDESVVSGFHGLHLVHPRQYLRKIDELKDPKTYSIRKLLREMPNIISQRLR